MNVAVVALAVLAHVVVAGEDPWGGGPEAPPPAAPLPYPQAPREPGAHGELLDVPQNAPDPKGALLDDGVANGFVDHRFLTLRSRTELYSRGALDLDTALVDVPGLWLRHEQAGNAHLLLRGLDDADVDVTLDDVPLFDLAGLLSPLEQLSSASTARLSLHHGPRAFTTSGKGSAGVVDVDTLAPGALRDHGESFALHGVLGGGYGGPDLEKGVFAAVETGWGRARFAVHATLLNRQDLVQGRTLLDAGDDSVSILERSGGDGGAIGARVDVVPHRGLHVFTTWHSSRTLDAPHPALCQGDDESASAAGAGLARDCTRTTERGLDLWIAGGDQAIDVAGVDLVIHGRAHMQHGLANEERAGSSITFIERSFDDGVRAGGRAWLDVALPAIALGDVWTPRATLGVDGYADRFASTFFSRSLRRADAEPPGDGIEDPTRARLQNGATTSFTALQARLEADGAHGALWSAGRLSNVDLTGELGARARLLEDLDAYVVVVHRGVTDPTGAAGGTGVGAGGSGVVTVPLAPAQSDASAALPSAPPAGIAASSRALTSDDTVEGGLSYALPWFDVGGAVYGSARSARSGTFVDGGGGAGGGGGALENTVAYGFEARGALRPGVLGLSAAGTLAVVVVDDGALLDANRTPHADVANPMGTLELAWEPKGLAPLSSAWAAGFFSRARFWLPQQRLSSAESLDRALCPELPTDDQLAAGTVQSQPCTGATGAFLFDLGAHVDVGAFRVDAVAENLLDQQAKLRDEPIGFGGTAFRALLTIAL